MKKLVLSIAFVLGATFAFGQELTKEELKQQKKEIKALENIAKDAELTLQTDPIAAINAMKPVISNPLVKTKPFIWYVSVSAKKAAIDAENHTENFKTALSKMDERFADWHFCDCICNCSQPRIFGYLL